MPTDPCDDLSACRTAAELRDRVHRALCAKENLLPEGFETTETPLLRGGRPCGVQYSLHGPRSLRLEAIWSTEQRAVYFYDARGERYDKRAVPDLAASG